MRDLRNQCTIWEIAGGVSAINGLVCFALSSTFKISFGKWGIIVGLLFYLLFSSTMLYLIWRVRRIVFEDRFQGHVKALIFIVVCFISVMLDKLVPGKSDALSIISYGSFALMSLSTSRKCELGFETGFFSFFLSLFFQQLCKINLKLSPIALLFCLLVFVLRHYSESSEEQSGSITPNVVHPIEVGPPNVNETVIEIGDEDNNEEEVLISQDSSGMGEVLGESVASRWTRARRRAAKVGKGLSKHEKAQKLALSHWLEVADPRHRYCHNLSLYYDVWFGSRSAQPFFDWLDVGEGKEVNLEKCPRTKLESQCIKYLGPKEREEYEVIVEGGKLVYKVNRKLLDTDDNSKWIFVLSPTRSLYVGQKQKGLFHHSSFLAGGATIAAGRLVAHQGVLEAVWPYSEYYNPTEDNFREFISFLEERNVDLSTVQTLATDEKFKDL